MKLELEHQKTNILTLRYGECNIEEMVFKIKKDLHIKTVDSAKFLGIVFDRKLNWEIQLNTVTGKANKVLQILKYLNRVSCGMEIDTARMIYKSYEYKSSEYFRL